MLLVTLGVPIDSAAAVFAVDAAVESGQPLIVANIVELPPLAMSVRMGYDQLEDPPELDETLRGAAALAASVGVRVERLRVKSPRPLPALLELVAEREPGLLVFGPDRSRIKPGRYRRATRLLRERAPCLLWTAA